MTLSVLPKVPSAEKIDVDITVKISVLFYGRNSNVIVYDLDLQKSGG